MKTRLGRFIAHSTTVSAIAASVAAVCLVLLAPVPAAASNPAPPSLTRSVGPTSISLEASPAVIAQNGEFDFVLRARLAEKTQYLQARMRLFMPSGSLIYQKTFIRQSLKPSTVRLDFKRTVGDLGLEPGTYPAELSVRMLQGEELTETVLPTALRIYNEAGRPSQVAFVARVSAQPLSDSQGDFVSDPAQLTRAREDVSAIAQHVLDDADARLGLALSPMMLEEWLRIAGGYRFLGAEGESVAKAGEPVPAAYAATLDLLKRAHATGRLELLTLGYSDPDLSELARAGMLDDVETQYARGRASARSAIGVEMSAGSAPSFGTVPAAAVPWLARAGVDYAVVDGRQVSVGRRRPFAGVYPLDSSDLRVLAARQVRLPSATTTEAAYLLASLFETHAKAGDTPQTLLLDVGPGATTAENLVRALELVGGQPWLKPALPRQLANTSGPRAARLVPAPPSSAPPKGFWQTVHEARTGAQGLAFALGSKSVTTAQAARGSLIAQSSVWQGFDRDWGPAGRGLAYAAASKRLAEQAFGPIELTARSVTLAGSSGLVPISIDNDTEGTIRVTITTVPGTKVAVDGPKTRNMVLQPGENFVEIPVRMNNALSGSVRIALTASEQRISSKTVSVRASYLDRLATVAGVLAVLIGLLGYIIFRVRSVKSTDGNAE